MIAICIINFNCYFTIYNIPSTVRIFERYELLIRKSVNRLNIRISFYRGLKMKWLANLPNIFNKEVT